MADAGMNRVISLLTVCRRSGNLLLGFDAVTEAAKLGKVQCILLAADTAPRTEKEVRFQCGEIPVRKLSETMEAMQRFFRKRTAVFGVCGHGFADRLLMLLDMQ